MSNRTRAILAAAAFAVVLPTASFADSTSAGSAIFLGGAASSGTGLFTQTPAPFGTSALVPLDPDRAGNHSGPDAKWGDPLSADLVNNRNAQLRLKYFGEAGANGSTQAIGVKLTLPR